MTMSEAYPLAMNLMALALWETVLVNNRFLVDRLFLVHKSVIQN